MTNDENSVPTNIASGTQVYGGRDGIVSGSDGSDLIDQDYTGDPDGDRIDAGDAILAGAAPNDDLVQAGDGDDTVFAGLGDDEIYGGEGNDQLFGKVGDDLIFGGAGTDILSGGGDNDTLDGGADGDLIFGDQGNDVLIGGAGADTLDGGDDRDIFLGATPGDMIDGGEGGDDFDTLDLRGSGPLAVVFDADNPENGTITFFDADGADIGSARFVNVERVILPDADDGATPVTNPDTASTPEDEPVVIDVLGNDTDPNGDPLTVISATAPNGTVEINPDGTLTYTPDLDFNGPDEITYTVTDPDGNTATSTVAVTVTPVNDAPVANPDAIATPLDTPVTLDIVANDTDVDGDPLTILGTPTSADGTVTVGPDGRSVTFTPNAGFVGTTVIDYTVTDPEGLTATSTLTVTVADDGATPVTNPDTASTPEDEPVVIDVLGNDTDPNGDPLTVISATAPNGTVEINPDGTLTYTPDLDFNGPDEITYTVTDPDGNTATSTVAVTVTPVNDAPVANPDAIATPLDTPVTLDIVANDTDVDGDPLTILGTPTSADGTVTVGPDGRSVTFTPNAGFVGTTVIAYTVTDPTGAIASSTLSVNVAATPLDGIVEGSAGNDLIDVTYTGDPEGDRIDNNDAIFPGIDPNADVVFAEAGDDVVLSGRGPDEVYGGDGADFIDTSAPLSDAPLPDLGYPGLFPADADPENDRDLVFGGDGNDTIITGDDADTIYGDAGADAIDGGIDADLIYGGTGDDIIVGGEGADTIFGDEGDDQIFAGLNPIFPDELNIPDATDLVPTNGTDLVFGGDGNDTIFGADDADALYGDAGDDQLFGEIDNDSLFGGDGADFLDGGEGDDVLEGDAGNDTLTGGDGVDSLFGGDDRDTFTGITPGDIIDGGDGGDDFDTLDLRGTVPAGGSLNVVFDANPENGTVTYRDASGAVIGTAVFTEIETVVPCFTPGTAIATPRGERLVEELRVGDRIITRDNGIQEIRWIGAKTLSAADLYRQSHLKPILIKRGSLGDNLPERDMLVSPNHRMLVSNEKTSLYFDEREVLASAKHLTGTAGVSEAQVTGTTYIHFMFDQHEVVLSNGCWTESFQPGDYTLKGIGNAQRAEILELFPELATQKGLEGYQSARRSLKRHEAMLLTR